MTKDRYLFRGFHKEENGKETIYIDGQAIRGKWIYGYIVEYESGNAKIAIPSCRKDLMDKSKSIYGVFEVIPETVGQWSGLENPWLQKIFDGDILRDYGNEIEDWEVSYEYGKFVGTYDNVCADLWEIHDMEVVGTIFDKEV